MQKLHSQAYKLSPGKLELLDQLLKKKGITVQQAEIIPRVEKQEFYPLSSAQERLWFIEQLEPGTPAYNIASVIRLEYPVSVPALQRALNQLITRHEVLRTTFSVMAGQPVQRIAHDFDPPLRVIDLSALPAETREAEVQLLIDDEVQRPFELEQGPLLRVQLLRLVAAKHVLLVTMHHIISDGWSMEIFFAELTQLYEAALKGEEAKLEELRVQYGDYAVWQRGWLKGAVLEEGLSYWREQLKGAPSVLELPLDRPRPAVQSYRGAFESFSLSAELTQALKRLSREEGATLFMTLLAAFQLLLWRYSGQAEVVVGTPVANRTRAEIEGLIGFFVNTLVLRVKVEGGWSFRQLLKRVREVCVGAYAHQEVPFEKVVEELQPQRSLSHSPLFQVMFVLQNQTVDEEESRSSDQPKDEQLNKTATAKFDLTLTFAEKGKQLHGRVDYKKELFERETIRRMLRHFKKLLEEAVKNSEQRIAELPLLHEVEREQILREWNSKKSSYPSTSCVHELFETQAAATPEAIAVVYQEEQLTYAELNTRANRLAHHLLSLGVGPETLVGICMERSTEMVVSLLAILKAGGAYLPLDPAYPTERLSFMLDDAGVRVLLTQTELLERIPAGSASMLCLDSLEEELARQSGTNPATRVGAENLAYVIYTSGSSGQPKGVLVAHRNVAHLGKALQETIYRDHGSALRVGVNASLCFDGSVKQLIQMLEGHTLHLLSEVTRRDPALLYEYVRAQELDVLDCTPGQLRQLLQVRAEQQGSGAEQSWLKAVLVGGEAIDQQLWWELGADVGTAYYNVYGPTECTVDATVSRIQVEEPLNIGRALTNTQLYVLDKDQEVVPIGVAGELYIGGAGVARGYLQQAALTAEKFVPHPYSGDGGERLYRTGDKVRYLSDGRLEFIGRIDGQVKVRGYRIELGEIEAVLGQHAQVREAVVLARSEESGEQRLVAYVVGRDGHPLTSAIRLYLRERLPQYMVPSSFVMLEQLPLLPNKKIDRPALASIGSDETHSLEEGKYVAARDIVELKLTQIWEKVLGVAPIGVRDNFFDLGGHSLLAMRLMALIHEGLNVRLPLSVLFREATVEELAKLLREQALPEKPTSIVEIQPGGDNRPFFCVHPMGGNVFCYLELARYLGPDQPFYAIQPAGLQGGEIPEITLEEIARSYLQEVRTVQPEGPYLLGGWSFGGVVAFEMAQQLRGAGQEVSLLALLEASALVVRDRRVYQGQADVENSWSLARMVWRLEGRETPFTEEDLQRVRQDERLNYILEQAKKDRVLGVDFELAYLLDWARGIKNSFKALADYEPRFYPGKVAVFEAEERLNGDDKSRFGWDELAQEVEAHVVSGNHFTIILEPHVRTLAQHLRESILTHSVHRV